MIKLDKNKWVKIGIALLIVSVVLILSISACSQTKTETSEAVPIPTTASEVKKEVNIASEPQPVPTQPQVLEKPIVLNLTWGATQDNNVTIVGLFGEKSDTGSKRYLSYRCNAQNLIEPNQQGGYFTFSKDSQGQSVTINRFNIQDKTYLITTQQEAKALLTQLNQAKTFQFKPIGYTEVNVLINDRKGNTLPCM